MILFKFPYDFDVTTLNTLTTLLNDCNENNSNRVGISSVYLPAFKEHCNSARDDEINKNLPSTWDEYAEHIKLILASGYTPDILIQEPQKILDAHTIQLYLNLGVNTFTVAEDDNAKLIKQLCPNAYIIASITKVLSPDEINNLDNTLYDEVCLYFWYNRNIKTIHNLPTHFKYSIIVNAWCSCTCASCYEHWFGDNRRTFICPEGTKGDGCGISNLEYFTPYIHTFKVQGREFIEAALNTFEVFLKDIKTSSVTKGFDYEHHYELGVEFPKVNKPH